MLEPSVLFQVIGLFLTIFAAIWSLAWWLSGQFTGIRNLLYTQIDKLNNTFAEKLDYHEKHDDQRFNSISKDIGSVRDDVWEIRVRNAANDNVKIQALEEHKRTKI